MAAENQNGIDAPYGEFQLALNVKHPKHGEAADAFWKYWKENGETHKHGYYESTWGAAQLECAV